MPALLRNSCDLPSTPYSYTDPEVEPGVTHLVVGRLQDLPWEDERVEELETMIKGQEMELALLRNVEMFRTSRLRCMSLFMTALLIFGLWLAAIFAPALGGPSSMFYVVISIPLVGVALSCALALQEGVRYDARAMKPREDI